MFCSIISSDGRTTDSIAVYFGAVAGVGSRSERLCRPTFYSDGRGNAGERRFLTLPSAPPDSTFSAAICEFYYAPSTSGPLALIEFCIFVFVFVIPCLRGVSAAAAPLISAA